MKLYDLQYDKLTLKTDECRSKIGHILREQAVFSAEGERLSDKRIYLETFPRYDGGCMLYISAIPERKTRKKTENSAVGVNAGVIICEVASAEELTSLCRCLFDAQEKGQADFSSRLFVSGSRYRLAVVPKSVCNRLLERMFGEFGKIISGEYAAARTLEFFTEQITENAVAKIAAG